MKKRAWIMICMGMAFITLQGQNPWSVQAFTDYYYVAAHHDPAVAGQNGFQFRRIYLTFDRQLDEAFKARLRFESASNDFTRASGKMSAVVKDAYLQWRRGKQIWKFGIAPTPTFALVEPHWGYRSVEKAPQDLHKLGNSRDTGISIAGPIGDKAGFHLMLGNGAANASETNGDKKFYASAYLRQSPTLLTEVYLDFERDGNSTSTLTLQGFVQLALGEYHVGLLADRQTVTAGGKATSLDLLSIFGRTKLSEKLGAFARIDALLSSNPSAAKISYTPMSKDGKPTVIILGVDYQVAPGIKIQPNFEWVTYRKDGPPDPVSDIYLKLTSSIKF